MIRELGDSLIPVLAILGSFAFLTTWVITATIDSLYKTRCNLGLKERMIDRGFSATEIDRVLRAGETTNETERESFGFVAPVPPVKRSLA